MLVSRHSLGLLFCDYNVYFGIVSFRIASSSYCIYEPQFMWIHCGNPLLYLISGTFYRLLGQSGAYHLATPPWVSYLLISWANSPLWTWPAWGVVLVHPALAPRTLGDSRLHFAASRLHLAHSGIHFSEFRSQLFRSIAGYWILQSQI